MRNTERLHLAKGGTGGKWLGAAAAEMDLANFANNGSLDRVEESVMPTMNVSLTPEMAAYVARELESGDYASASELVRDALRALRHDREVERETLAILRREIDLGLTQIETGELSQRTVAEILKGVLDEPA